jgi:hypothetical protein
VGNSRALFGGFRPGSGSPPLADIGGCIEDCLLAARVCCLGQGGRQHIFLDTNDSLFAYGGAGCSPCPIHRITDNRHRFLAVVTYYRLIIFGNKIVLRTAFVIKLLAVTVGLYPGFNAIDAYDEQLLSLVHIDHLLSLLMGRLSLMSNLSGPAGRIGEWLGAQQQKLD